MPGRSNDIETYTIIGTNKIVRAGDCVLIRATRLRRATHVARVENIKVDHQNKVEMRLRWYCFPDEANGGRRSFHGTKELFLSNHYNTQTADIIEDKCTVHSLNNYMKLENVGPEDYFCRFEYNTVTGGFTPDCVPVYCKCELPKNPDEFMLRCKGCKDWFHPDCLGMTIEEAKKQENFTCSEYCSSYLNPLVAGDCVLIRPFFSENVKLVAKVDKTEVDHQNRVKVWVRWYYRPENTIGGRKQFHGTKELFLSDQYYMLQSAQTIEGKCNVHSFEDYIKLDIVEPEDYICRFEYNTVTGCFTPDGISVYCKGEMPKNPDDFMVRCIGCNDWYQPNCLGMTIEEAKKQENCTCFDCFIP